MAFDTEVLQPQDKTGMGGGELTFCGKRIAQFFASMLRILREMLVVSGFCDVDSCPQGTSRGPPHSLHIDLVHVGLRIGAGSEPVT